MSSSITDFSSSPSGDTAGMAPRPMTVTRPLYWSIWREVWENRSIYLAPLAVTALVLLGTFISVLTLPHRLRSLPPDSPRQHSVLTKPFDMAPAPIMLATLIVGAFYAIDALYGERRDRSILFWKSLPVSDVTTVLAKASIPLLVLPVIAFVLSVVTQVILLMLANVVLLGSGLDPGRLWREFRFFQGLPVMVYGLTVHALWFAPIYGWLLLVSAWARRAPFLWAVLPIVAIAAVERIAFSSSVVTGLLKYRLVGAMKTAFAFDMKSGGNIDKLSQLTPLTFLTTPGLWVGLAVAAAFVAAAVRLRRNREPI